MTSKEAQAIVWRGDQDIDTLRHIILDPDTGRTLRYAALDRLMDMVYASGELHNA